MKYLGIHKLIWFLLLLSWLIVEIIFVSIVYILYIMWNFKLPKFNMWYYLHNDISEWDEKFIEDYNPWQTFVRRYNFFNDYNNEY